MSDMTVANTILAQLGGNQFVVMTGAKYLTGSDNMLMFALPATQNFVKDKIIKVVIELTSLDLYTVTFYKKGKARFEMDVVKMAENVDCGQLREVFREATGLATRI